MFKGLRPSLTPAQVAGLLVAGVPVCAAVLRVFGVYDLAPEQIVALNNAIQWAAILAGALFVSDAGLRSARNHADAKVSAATAQASAVVASRQPNVVTMSSGGTTPVFVGGSGARPSDPETGLSESAEPVDPEAEAVPADDLPDDDTELSDPVARAIAEEVQQGRS